MELYRDGVDCPWGFRLKGGIDVDGGTPLEVIRVRHVFDKSKYCYGVYIIEYDEREYILKST